MPDKKLLKTEIEDINNQLEAKDKQLSETMTKKQDLIAEIDALEDQIDSKEKQLRTIQKAEDEVTFKNYIGKYFSTERFDEYYKVLDVVPFLGETRLRVLTLLIPRSTPFSGYISIGHTIARDWTEITEDEFNKKRNEIIKKLMEI